VKAPYYVDTNTADPTARIGLTWEADSIVVSNPTIYTLAVRVGSGGMPTAANADIVVAPASALALPVSAREFVVTATTPKLSNPPTDMPTRASVLLTKGEPAPAFGGIPLAGALPPNATILLAQSSRASGTYFDLIPVPAYVRTMVFRNVGATINSLTVTGNQSGQVYYQALSPGNLAFPTFLFDSELDTDVTVTLATSSGVQNQYTLLGYTERMDPQDAGRDARQLVNIFPLGYNYIPVAAPGGGALPVAPAMPARTAVVIKASGGVAGIGSHDFGPISTTGWRGATIELDLTGTGGGAGVSVTPIGFFGLNTYILGPATGTLTTRSYYEFGPGLGGTPAAVAFGVGTSVARDLGDALSVRIGHPDAALYTYSISARPMY
jgi:hypothetical protein